jgi:preprotein translocase subunit SecF
MRFFQFAGVNLDFVGNRNKFFAISGMFLLITLVAFIYRGGPNYGIDFTGGVLMQFHFKNANIELQRIRNAIEEVEITSFELQRSGNFVMIRVKRNLESRESFNSKVKNSIQSKFPNNPMKVERIEYVGPSVGKNLFRQTVCVFLFAFLGMIAYVAFRFKSGFWGVAAIIGIIHDMIVSFGFVVLVNKEVNINVVAALLTIAGYSINDTIVLFNRIKENLKLCTGETFKIVINKSINEVLVRTVVTSLTVFIVASSLFFLGGEAIHTFSYIMIIGTVLGVFSTIFICAMLIYKWETTKNEHLKMALKQQLLRLKR